MGNNIKCIFIVMLALCLATTSWQKFEAVFQGQCTHLNPCEQKCINQIESTFECACFDGFQLSVDGFSCEVNQGPVKEPNSPNGGREATSERAHPVSQNTLHIDTDYRSEIVLAESKDSFVIHHPVDSSHKTNVLKHLESKEESVLDNTDNVDDSVTSSRDAEKSDDSFHSKHKLQKQSTLFTAIPQIDPTNTFHVNSTESLHQVAATDHEAKVVLSSASLVSIKDALPKLIFRNCEDLRCDNGGHCIVDKVKDEATCQCPLGTHGQFCQHYIVVQWPQFSGDGVVILPVLETAEVEFNITILFKPESADGLLLCSGEHVDLSGDFFMLGLRHGKAEFRFDCGSGMGMIKSANKINLGKWNSVSVTRHRKKAWLSVNGGKAIYGESMGLYSRISFQDDLYVGGAVDMTAIAERTDMEHGLTGCIKEVVLNGHAFDLRSRPLGEVLSGFNVGECSSHVCDGTICLNGGSCRAVSPEEGTCHCPLEHIGPNCKTAVSVHIPEFGGHSYLRHHGLKNTVLSFLELDVAFRPHAKNGLLLYNGNHKTDDFIMLSLEDGFVEFHCNLGNGLALIRSMEPINMEIWHHVKILRTGRDVIMITDEQTQVEAMLPGGFTELTLHSNLFIGGIRSKDDLTALVHPRENFHGCIQKVVINGIHIELVKDALSGINIDNCHHPCSGSPCYNGGICVVEQDSYSCDCKIGYTGYSCEMVASKDALIQEGMKFSGRSFLQYTKQNIISELSGKSNRIEITFKTSSTDGLLFWIGQDEMYANSDFMYIGIKDGHIELGYNLGNGVAIVQENSTWIPNNVWHTVLVERFAQSGSVRVNFGHAAETTFPGHLKMLDVNSGLYIGGTADVPFSTLQRYQLGFKGCISKVVLGEHLEIKLWEDAATGWNIDKCNI